MIGSKFALFRLPWNFRAPWKKKACPIVTPYPKGGALSSCQPCPGVPSMQSRMKQSNAAGRAVVISLEQLTIAEELSLRSDGTVWPLLMHSVGKLTLRSRERV